MRIAIYCGMAQAPLLVPQLLSHAHIPSSAPLLRLPVNLKLLIML